MTMNRFDKSCVRAFFTLPKHLTELPNSWTLTLSGKPFNTELQTASSIVYGSTKYFIIWFDSPDQMDIDTKIDLSFRDFSFYDMVPVVLIRRSA